MLVEPDSEKWGSNNPQVVPVRQFSVAHLREEAEGCCFIGSFSYTQSGAE